MEDWPAMKKWQFEVFQDDPRIEEGVYIGQRQEVVPLRLYTRYLHERAMNDTVPWMIFMPDVFDMYPDLRQVCFIVPVYLEIFVLSGWNVHVSNVKGARL